MRTGLASALALVCLLTACTIDATDEGYGTLPATAPARRSGPPGPTAAAPTAETTILARYRAFWTTGLPRTFAAAGPRRRDALAAYAVDPELATVVGNLAALDVRGETQYGVDVPLRESVRRAGAVALVTGCLDSSRAGVADRRTGRRRTRGVTRNPVRVTLVASADRGWRVSAVVYPGGQTC